MIRPDLHLHTNCSDGVMSPELLLHECSQKGITLMAVTDHDTMSGSDALCRAESQIPVIPAVELSMAEMPGLHLLGYGLTRAEELRKKITELAEMRDRRAQMMIEKLKSMGMSISYKELLSKRQLEGGKDSTIGRPHIARALVRAGYCRNMQEAFARYIGNDKPAYIRTERMHIEQAIELLNRCGFLPVLAHPRELQLEDYLLESLLDKYCMYGLKGIEVYHPSARAKGYAPLVRMASNRQLLVTGGSDFHQENDNKHGGIGSTIDAWESREKDISAFMEALKSAAEKIEGGELFVGRI